MNDTEFDFDYSPESDLFESLTETSPEDWLPDCGVREELDPETVKLLNQF
jgi:hypothetical protein|tara:strand:- start:3516 stop:3665 length:150 start_codon:yes stop_codon:yes gene_type:complete